MKILNIEHNGISYEFRLLEMSQVIEIIKESKVTYLIKPSERKHGAFRCNCPGQIYHHHCWHEDQIRPLLDSISVDEPWASWSEEAGSMQYSI
jgi:hypothetical protein